MALRVPAVAQAVEQAAELVAEQAEAPVAEQAEAPVAEPVAVLAAAVEVAPIRIPEVVSQ